MNERTVGTSDFCRNLPALPRNLVSRDNLYEHIEKIFTDVTRVVYLEGDPMTGKSELLAGYLRDNQKSSIGVFLAPGDAYFYSPDYVKLVLAEQIYWLVNGVAANYESVDQLTFTRLIHQLQKLGRRGRITFILDGLAEQDLSEHRLNKEILNVLPFSQSEFRFLISGSSNLFRTLDLDRHSPKSVSLIPLSKDEALKYFQDLKHLSPKDVNDIRIFCKGAIGLIAKFRELIEGGLTLSQVLADKDGGLTDLLEAEWTLVSKDELSLEVLSCVCFSNRLLAIDQIATLTGSSRAEVLKVVTACRFVEIDQTNETVSIRATQQRTFVQKKLALKEKSIRERFVSELLKNPYSTESTKHLPEQLMSVGRHEDIVRRLNHDHFVNLLQSEKSLRTLQKHFQLGLDAARILKDEGGMIGFGLSISAIKGLTFSVGTKMRIEALMRLGSNDQAVELAMAAPTNEERLELLSVTARASYESKLPISRETRKQIQNLQSLVSAESLGDLAVDIACNLLVVDPNAAIRLFNETNDEPTRRREPREKLGVSGVEAPLQPSSDPEKGLGTVELTLNDRDAERFADAVGGLVERLSAEKMISLHDGTEPANELFMLKQWLSRNKRDSKAWKVADHALDITLKDRRRAPRIQDFRAIAVVLPYIEEEENAKRLIRRIEVQLGTQLTLGTTAESVRLEMLIERARQKFETGSSDLALINLYARVDSIADAGVKTASLAWMLYGLQRLTDRDGIETRTTVISSTTDSLVRAMELLLESSADHYSAARGAIYALALTEVDFAFQLISKLNMRARRDRAYITLAEELVAARVYEKKPGALIRSLEAVDDEGERSLAILRCLSRVAEDSESGLAKCENEGILGLWRSLRAASFRFQAVVATYRIRACAAGAEDKLRVLEDEFRKIWPEIRVDWFRADLGYYLVRNVAKANREFAERWMREVVDERQSLKAPSRTLGDALMLTTQLACRCIGSMLVDESVDTDRNFKRLARLIDSVPHPQRRIQMWCDLGIYLHYRKILKLSNLIADKVQQVLRGDYSLNEYLRELLIAESAPFLFLSRPASANLFLSQIAQRSLRDGARKNICTVILTKKPTSEPYKSPANDEYEISQDDVAMLLSVVGEIENDAYIFEMVSTISASLTARHNEHRFRRTEARDHLNSLKLIVNEKLPQLENIKHEGYKVASLAAILKASSLLGTTVQNSEWNQLFDDAANIKNVADRVVVLALVASSAKNKVNLVRPNWFAEIRGDLLKIPTDIDRLDRHQWLAKILEGIDKSKAASLVQDAVVLTTTLSDTEDPKIRQKQLLDIAYGLNPDLVDKLIDLADSDKASTAKRDEFKESMRLRELQKELADSPELVKGCKATAEQLASLSTENLARLNGRRIQPRPAEEFANLASIASDVPISASFPMWSWIAENSVRRAEVVGRADSQYVKGLFAGACGAAELTLALIGNAESAFATGNVEADGLVRPGDRDAVFSKISAWAAKNDGKTILISDPFFGTDDVDVLYAVAGAAPNSNLRLITSKKHLRDSLGHSSPEDSFKDAWIELCDMPLPEIEVLVLGIPPDGGHPVHDRWLTAEDSGLRLGTSSNSIGKARVSEVSEMDADAARAKYALLNDLADRKIRDWDGDRVQFSSFVLAS